MNLQSQVVYVDKKNNFKQCICILEEGASGEQVDDIENIIIKNLLKYNYVTLNCLIFEKKIMMT
jgi:hypothetical protein